MLVLLVLWLVFRIVPSLLAWFRQCKRPSRVYLEPSPDAWNELRVLDEKRQDVPNLLGIRGEFWTTGAEERFAHRLQTNPALVVLLVSSYQEFPATVTNPFEAERTRSDADRFVLRYGERVLLWCHCFRDADSVWCTSVPKLLLSESDLLQRGPRQLGTVPESYDFVASVGPGAWNAHVRQLDVVVRLLRAAASELDLRCVLVGDTTRAHLFLGTTVQVLPFLPHADFLRLLRSTRFLLCAARADASPRILVEAGRQGCALLVHRGLLGGWKYVLENVTGRFFDDNESAAQLLACFAADFSGARDRIRAYFEQTTDPEAQAARLACALYSAQSIRTGALGSSYSF